MTALLQPKQQDAGADQRAASSPSASVWVNASAGSGKTKVLTERVLRLLLTGVRPEKILCLTFTRAGAAEMANRLTARLSKWAVCDDNSLSAELADLQGAAPTPKQMTSARRLFARVLSCAGSLRIRTIHSFCQEILSRFPLEAGLPPHFALIDEEELERLQNEVLDDLLREAGHAPHGALAQALDILVAVQGEKNIASLLREILKMRGRLAEAAQAAGGAEKLIGKIRAALNLGREDSGEFFRANAMQGIPEQDMRQLALWLGEGSKTHIDRADILASILTAPDRAASFEAYCSLFLTEKKEPRKSFGNKEILAKYPQIDQISAGEALRLRGALERIEAADIAEKTASILFFGLAFAASLAKRKAARAAVDYDDLILFSENLLRRADMAPWILYKLDEGLDHILVDEAQDTSRAQWAIVQQLVAEFYAGSGARGNDRTLFVVGDEKQSIFSFQNADPQAFLSRRNFFARRFAEAEKNMRLIPLRTSFRSAPAILQAVDTIFARDDARRGVSPDPIIHQATKGIAGRIEVWPLLKPVKDDSEASLWPLPTGYEEEHDPAAELAQQIAGKITALLRQKQATPGDIMILLRRRGRFADLMVRALKAQKIPVTGVDRMELMKQLPVMDLLAAMRFALLPEDDLNLAELLRSPLLGLGEEDLMKLAIGRTGTLWQSLKDKAASFQKAYDYLTAKLNEADFSTPFAFLSNLLNAPCPANATSGRQALWMRLGEEALDPIEELLNKAQNFSQMREPSLQNFLHWLGQSDAEIKRELDNGKNQSGGQVRIMTVHASKGLEAPIVFLPDTTAVPRATDLPKLQWSDDNLPLFLPRKPDFGAAYATWQQARERQMEEYRRLFYVALTRASHRLYICGWLGARGDAAPADSWYALAAQALQPLHQAQLATGQIPEPCIAFADAPALPGAAEEKETAQPVPQPLPDWAARRIVPPSTLPKPPAQIPVSAATPDAAYARGRIIHRLLQSLPDITTDKRAPAVTRFLSQPRHNLDAAAQTAIAQEVLRLLDNDNFKILFSADSLAEAPIAGTLNGIPVFRQIDRLCQRGDEIWIVDYKTNRPPPKDADNIPPAYRAQLGEYRALLTGIYPGKRIRCFLLWTFTANLMEISF